MALIRTNPDISKNAYLNWAVDSGKSAEAYSRNFLHYADSYKNTADQVIGGIGDNRNKIADSHTLGALFLYRHSLELLLKSIIIIGSIKEKRSFENKIGGHSIKGLWGKTKNILIEQYRDDFNQNKTRLKQLDSALEDLSGLDDSSIIFRYPYTTELERNFIGLNITATEFEKDVFFKENAKNGWSYSIDYEYFKQEFGKLFSFLAGCYEGIYEMHLEIQELTIKNTDTD